MALGSWNKAHIDPGELIKRSRSDKLVDQFNSWFVLDFIDWSNTW